MRRHGLFSALAALALPLPSALAARQCSNATASTLSWRVGDGRYDVTADGLSVVALSISPGTTGTIFECVSQWPSAWAGWDKASGSNADGAPVWSDCIWTGNGGSSDRTVSFALDWTTKKLWLAHTFACSDKKGSDSLATGSGTLDFTCSADGGGCVLKLPVVPAGGRAGFQIPTKPTTQTPTSPLSAPASPAAPSPLSASPPAGQACTDLAASYQSWELLGWERTYEVVPGTTPPPLDAAPPEDSGPSFTLRNMASGEAVTCTTASKGATFKGTCKVVDAAATALGATVAFEFDPKLDLLTVQQTLKCGDSAAINSTGVAYVQAGCDRQDNMLICSADPLWVGSKTWS